jgi:hypothetical protein
MRPIIAFMSPGPLFAGVISNSHVAGRQDSALVNAPVAKRRLRCRVACCAPTSLSVVAELNRRCLPGCVPPGVALKAVRWAVSIFPELEVDRTGPPASRNGGYDPKETCVARLVRSRDRRWWMMSRAVRNRCFAFRLIP